MVFGKEDLDIVFEKNVLVLMFDICVFLDFVCDIM